MGAYSAPQPLAGFKGPTSKLGGSVAEWLAQKGLGSNRGRDAVG